MNKTFFYSHLIKIEPVIAELDKLDLSYEQKIHLTSLIDSSLHHTILDAILSELSSQDKKIFLNYLNTGKHSEIWQFLSSKIDKIEDKIKKAADSLTIELHRDLKKARK